MRVDEPNPMSSGGEEDTPADPSEKSPSHAEESAGEGETKAASGEPNKAGEGGEKPKQRRGFAAMDRAKVRAIAMLGGAAVHRKGTAHRFSREEAREAGRKGGLAPHRVRGRKLPPEPTDEKSSTKEG